MIYAGVGGRKTPSDFLELFRRIGFCLAVRHNFTLRSGHAPGADLAFETGCDEAQGNKEIFIPWKGFNQSNGILVNDAEILSRATRIASNIHPGWNYLSNGAKKPHQRNIFQVVGAQLNDPVDFVLCWTEKSKKIGGTRTAIIFAENLNIPVFNFGNFDVKLLDDLLRELESTDTQNIFSVFEKFLVDIQPVF